MDKLVRALVIKLLRCRRALPRFPVSSLNAVLLAFSMALQVSVAQRASAQTLIDLELVVAVDVSLSMDLEEQRLQRDGYVAAFRDAEIHGAIASGVHGRISVAYVEWAGPDSQSVVIPWTILEGSDSARAFADKLEATPISRARLTSISAALRFSQDLFSASNAKGIRRVIDVSGDGPNNAGQAVAPVRDEVIANGIVINGLPIMLHVAATSAFDISDLDRYYASCVIGGAGAFMVPVRALTEFASAIRRKLLLEISGFEPPVRVMRTQNAADGEYDCLKGEKQWQLYFNRIPN